MNAQLEQSASQAFFEPNAIALIGASASPARIGGRTIATLLRHGFKGGIFPVNPSHAEIQGLRAYKRLEDITAPIDLAVISVPAVDVLSALKSCAEKGVRAVVIYSSGFAEVGGDGIRLQNEIRDFIRNSSIRVLGPNCLGFMSMTSRALCTFGQAPNLGLPEAGGLSIISQSGAFGTYTYAAGLFRRMPISRWITTGNEADVDFADCVEWLADDTETQVILGYMEGCRDGRKLIGALQYAHRAGKPVVILKVGRTQAGAAAAESHTAALAGDDSVYDGIFRQFGAHRASSVDEFFDIGYAVLRGISPRGNRIAVVTASGGAGVLIADAASAEGFSLPSVPEDVQNHLKGLVPFAGVRNPIDVTAQVANDPDLFLKFFSAVAETGLYDAILCFQGLSGVAPGRQKAMIERWTELRGRFPDLPIFISGKATPDVATALEALCIPIFEDPSRMARTAAAICRSENADDIDETSTIGEESVLKDVDWQWLNEVQAATLLNDAGIPMAMGGVAASPEEAVATAERLGFPVVLKIISHDIAHKSDIGGVAVDLADAHAVRNAYAHVLTAVQRHKPEATVEGVLVAPMIKNGVEAIIGARMDPTFGPVVMVGLGGTMVEVLKDISLRVAPISHRVAHRMIDELRGRALLDGLRGKPPMDRDALADALVRLGQLAASHAGRFSSIEINPLLVRPQGVIGLDALIA